MAEAVLLWSGVCHFVVSVECWDRDMGSQGTKEHMAVTSE